MHGSVTVNGSSHVVHNVSMCMSEPTEGYLFHAKYHLHQFIDAGMGPLKLLIFGNFENIIATYTPVSNVQCLFFGNFQGLWAAIY